MTVDQAAFLVGGKGTRLGPLTASTPKPLLEIADGLIFLDVLIAEAARQGFTKILLLAGYCGELVEQRYQGRRIRDALVSVVREETPCGTAGALANAASHLEPWFLLANGDTFFDVNLRALAARADERFLARLALRDVADVGRFGSVELDGGRINSFGEKTAGRSGPGLINAGIYLLNREVASLVSPPASLETEVFPRLAAAGRLEGLRLEGYFLDMGIPETYARARAEIPARLSRPAAFLDRDGVLNVDIGYAHLPEHLQWIGGAREAIRLLNDKGHFVFVVTNQAGVARGYYAESEVGAFHRLMQSELAEAGAHVDAFYYCPFHEDGVLPAYRVPDHPDRKPNPGMIERAFREWPVRREGSFLIGDKASDVQAAERAGLPGYMFDGGDLVDAVREIVRKNAGATAAPAPC